MRGITYLCCIMIIRNGDNMITVSHLEKNYGNIKVLSDVSLQIEDGSVYGIIGHSGAV